MHANLQLGLLLLLGDQESLEELAELGVVVHADDSGDVCNTQLASVSIVLRKR